MIIEVVGGLRLEVGGKAFGGWRQLIFDRVRSEVGD
jgi:hypothetical protein